MRLRGAARGGSGGDRPRELALDRDADELQRVVRILGASVNVRLLQALAEARRRAPEGGWLYLSDIAQRLGEAPGTISLAAQKLLPLLEEKRLKGKRYFRSRVTDLRLTMRAYAREEEF